MASVLENGGMFPPELVGELVNTVKGKSSLSVLSASAPIAFNGRREFVFSMDKEVDIVAESGAKSVGGGAIAPRTILPIKFEYSMRVSDEFMYGSEEVQLDYLRAFSDGFARKIARGFDLAAMHGINPRTGTASEVVGTNNFDSMITNIASNSDADQAIEAAIALVQGAENDVTGVAMAPAFRSALAALTYDNGVRIYPELAWGNAPSALNGLTVSANSTVAGGSGNDLAIVGDFENAFRWGYAKEIPLKVIEYGNPDNDTDLGDLQGRNQVLLRSEIYIGWGILDETAFALIQEASGGDTGSPTSLNAKASKKG